MVYELYVDSLFLVNAVMNLYLLMLVNKSTLRTATRGRMVLGACLGAAVYILPFMVELPALIKWPPAFIFGMTLMVSITFRPKGITAFLMFMRKLFIYSFLMGGLLLFAESVFPPMRRFMTEIFGVLGVGALGFLLFGFIQNKGKTGGNSSCKAILINGDTRISVPALLDSGNSLREPISGKPVSIIDPEIYGELWGDVQTLYRAIPYRSIGKSGGILKGYILPELELELEGVTKSFRNVYVAVCEEDNVGMILNPDLLEESA